MFKHVNGFLFHETMEHATISEPTEWSEGEAWSHTVNDRSGTSSYKTNMYQPPASEQHQMVTVPIKTTATTINH